MFDFLHFLGFLAFNDAMENNRSSSKYSGGDGEDPPFGCVLSATIFIFAAIFGMAYSSWGLFLGIAAVGILLGVLHYNIFDKKDNE